jgi:hypothetical protein
VGRELVTSNSGDKLEWLRVSFTPFIFIFLELVNSTLERYEAEGVRIEIIPLEPDQRSYLRREAPESPRFFAFLFGGYPFARTDTSIFQQSLGYKQVCRRDFAMVSDFLSTVVTRRFSSCSNFIEGGILSKVLRQVFAL